MRFLLAAALALATVIPAAAQQPAPRASAGPQSGPRPATGKPATVQPATTQVSGTPGTGGTRTVEVRSAADVEASMKRAQKAADDRAQAWDAKMKRTMGSICSGC